jgi:predicted ester cyclase
METTVTSEITSPASNVELVRAGFQAFNAGDADECMALATPDLIINLAELPEPQRGREVWRQGFEMMKHAFPDLQAHIEDIFAAQDKVAVPAPVPRHPLRRVPGLSRDRPHRRLRQPRVLPHRRRAHRGRVDLLRHGHLATPAQLTISQGKGCR